MLSSVLDTLRGWPAVRRGSLSLLLPPGDAAPAKVHDAKVAAALRALGYVVRRASAGPAGLAAVDADAEAGTRLVAVVLRGPEASGPGLIDRIRQEAQRLPTGGWLLVRTPSRDREQVAAAFLHAGLAQVAQDASRRSVLTCGRKRADL